MPAPDGLAHIDAVENRGGEGLDPRAFLGKNALSLLFQKPAIILDHQVFRGIRADAGSVQLAGPFARNLLLLARLKAVGLYPPLHAGQMPPQADAPGVDPDFVTREACCLQIRGRLLWRIAVGRLPDLPREVVVG